MSPSTGLVASLFFVALVFPTADVKLFGKIPPLSSLALTCTNPVLVAVFAVRWATVALALFGIVSLRAGGAAGVMQHQVALLAAQTVGVFVLTGEAGWGAGLALTAVCREPSMGGGEERRAENRKPLLSPCTLIV